MEKLVSYPRVNERRIGYSVSKFDKSEAVVMDGLVIPASFSDRFTQAHFIINPNVTHSRSYLDYRDNFFVYIGKDSPGILRVISYFSENLQYLSIYKSTVDHLDLSHLTGLRELYLQGCENLRLVRGLSRLNRLRVLHLSMTGLDGAINLSAMSELTELKLFLNPNLREIKGLENPWRLKSLALEDTQVMKSLDLAKLPMLRRLYLRNSGIRKVEAERKLIDLYAFRGSDTIEDWDFLKQLPALTELELSGCDLDMLPSADSNPELIELNISSNPIGSLEGISAWPKLTRLNISDTDVRVLPKELSTLQNLYRLAMCDLELDEIPAWIPDTGMEFHLYGSASHWPAGVVLCNTTIKGTDMSIFSQPRQMVQKWLEENRTVGMSAPLNEVKVVFLGDGEAGKSHTIARLLNDGGSPLNFSGDSTPGIVITNQEYRIGKRSIQVHFWDFGGQEILHSMHRMFLTKRTMYVILINARDDTQDDRARYWLHNVKSFADGAPVLLVLNKMDQNPNASVNESDLRAIYPGLTEVVKLSAMFDSQDKFNTNFTEVLKRQIGRMENLGFPFPHSWNAVKKQLQGMEKNYIMGSDYASICEKNGVNDEGDLRKSLLNWFNDLGVSICYGGNAKLRDYVILRPNWITNAVYAILFNKHPDTKNGIISHNAIFEMIQPPKEGEDPYRRTNSREVYSQQEIEFILNVMRKFRLSFWVSDEQEFMPVLCQRESLHIAEEYADAPDSLEFQMTFDYLPNNVLHRLMVELRQDLDMDNVWRTGAHFMQKSTGLSAVVKSEGNVLKIFVRGTQEDHRPNTYLCIIKDVLDNIVADMNLEAPKNEVLYKLDDKTERYDYDDLVTMRLCGETTIFSTKHKRRLQLDDILNKTGHRAEAEREQLLRDIITASMQLQANRQNWSASEDERNTYIRDLLRAMGYHVSDQTLIGISAGGKRAGELDLEIRRDPKIPWTLFEAMNLKEKGSIGYWNSHLKKLLDNYNPNGLPFLFLVSYVECSKDAFGGIVGDYYEHLRFYSPDKYILQSAAVLPMEGGHREQNHFIQTVKSIYDRQGFPTTVYQIFVQVGQ